MGARSGGGASGGMGSRSRSVGGKVTMPALTGSEKQVAWANDLRGRALRALESTTPYATSQPQKDIVSKIKQNIASKTDARFWIDNRYSVPSAFSNPSSQSAANSAIRGIMLKFYQLGLYSK